MNIINMKGLVFYFELIYNYCRYSQMIKLKNSRIAKTNRSAFICVPLSFFTVFVITRIVCRRMVCLNIIFIMTKKEELREFGKRLREFCLEKGYSEERLAEIASLHRNYIGMIERGKRNVTLLNIKKLARALGIEVGELLESNGG